MIVGEFIKTKIYHFFCKAKLSNPGNVYLMKNVNVKVEQRKGKRIYGKLHKFTFNENF